MMRLSASAASAALVAEQLDLLEELNLIATAIDAIEQQHGSHPLIDEARHRQQRVRAAALAQLNHLQQWSATVH
jgi:hypothetical protein